MNCESELKSKIYQLRKRIELGYGYSNKQIPQKRLARMKRKLFNMEYELAESQGNRYLKTGNINAFKG